MQVNTPLLCEISFQLIHGNPWWGMLLANEYINQSHPLRQIFIRKFQQSIGSPVSGVAQILSDILIAGRCKDELTKEEVAYIGSRVIPKRSKNTHPYTALPLPSQRRASRLPLRAHTNTRLASRQRRHLTERFSFCVNAAAIRQTPVTTSQLVAVYSVLHKSVAKSRFLENAIDSRMRIKTTNYSDVPAKALPVLLARTFAHHYSLT